MNRGWVALKRSNSSTEGCATFARSLRKNAKHTGTSTDESIAEKDDHNKTNLDRLRPTDRGARGVRGECGKATGGGCATTVGRDLGSCGGDRSSSCSRGRASGSRLWTARGDGRSGGFQGLRIHSNPAGAEIHSGSPGGRIDPDLSDRRALNPRGIARRGKMLAQRRRTTRPDRYVGLSHPSLVQYLSTRDSGEVVLGCCGSRRHAIWHALVGAPSMGEDLRGRMAAAAMVERCRAVEVSRDRAPGMESW